MPDDPFRLRVMKALCDQLKTITVDNGYAHDLSDYVDADGVTMERVFRGRDLCGENDGLPLSSVLEDPRQGESNNASGNAPQAVNPWRLLIQGFARDDKFHPLDPAYHLSGDVVKALASAKTSRHSTLGFPEKAPTVMKMVIGQPIHRPGRDEISSVAYCLVPVTLTLAEILDQPHA